jgi:hypothetical protein
LGFLSLQLSQGDKGEKNNKEKAKEWPAILFMLRCCHQTWASTKIPNQLFFFSPHKIVFGCWTLYHTKAHCPTIRSPIESHKTWGPFLKSPLVLTCFAHLETKLIDNNNFSIISQREKEVQYGPFKTWSNEGITSNEIMLTMMAKSFLLYVLYYIRLY